MKGHGLRVDLSLLRQGISIGFEFGAVALTELARLGEFIERNVYEPRSLREDNDGISFTLLNPPLRMGAFSDALLRWNGRPVPRNDSWVESAGGMVRSFAMIGRATPITLPTGQRTRVRFRAEDRASGSQHVRLELRSAAIPPLVWVEFHDILTRNEGG